MNKDDPTTSSMSGEIVPSPTKTQNGISTEKSSENENDEVSTTKEVESITATIYTTEAVVATNTHTAATTDNEEDTSSEPVQRGRKRKSDNDYDGNHQRKKTAREEAIAVILGSTEEGEEEEEAISSTVAENSGAEIPDTPGITTDVAGTTTPRSSYRLKSCEVEGCEKLRARGGYCLRHFKNKAAPIRSGTSDYERRICDVEACERLRSKGKFCHRHNKDRSAPIRNKSDGPMDRKKNCTIENCDRLQVKNGYCSRHFKDKDAPVLATPAFSFDADARWDELFPQLKAFYEENGHSRVPTSQKTDLARFVTHIRCVYRTKKQKAIKADPDGVAAAAMAAAADAAAAVATVDPDSIAAATAVADPDGAAATMVVDSDDDAAAAATASTAPIESASENPDDSTSTDVPAVEDVVHPDLSRSKLLTPERMEALKTVGFEFQLWTVEPSQWEQRFNELLAYKKKNGNFHVTNKQNSTLSSWCKTQRQRYKNTMAIYQGLYGVELSNPQKKAKELYEKAKEKAEEYKNEGNTKNRHTPTLSDIGEAKNMMEPERICKLNAVGFEWELQKDTYVESWENRYNQLLKFKVIQGHCRVPKSSGDNPQLGQWVKQMRKYHGWKEDEKPYPTTFTDERISRLNELGFEWRLKDTPLKGIKLEDGHHVARLPNNTADVTLQQLSGIPLNTGSNNNNISGKNSSEGNNNDTKQNWNNNWYEGGASV
mmetsp:Transcript_19905/g.22246  ORF Transcript_19905/g.22246 Transcript_19905/m.22246 type:complete len:715 (-) Transcript_19905:17-2161(-)